MKCWLLALVVAAAIGTSAAAQTAKDEYPFESSDGSRWLDFGILVEVQYRGNDAQYGSSGVLGDPEQSDQVFLRRLRPTIFGGINEDWEGVIQMDFGAGADGLVYDTTVRWVNFQYVGVEDAHLTFGSFKHFFSREFLTLGPHLQQIERTFAGNNDYGNPSYTIGLGWDHLVADRKLGYALSIGAENHDQDAYQMSFRSPANASTGSNQGFAVAGRVDYYPFGQLPYTPQFLLGPNALNRGDFHTDAWQLMVSAAGYAWHNDGDSNPYVAAPDPNFVDLEGSYGLELSGGVRGFGWSGDIEYQNIHGNTEDGGFTGGLYRNGDTELDKFTVNGGYMAFANEVELNAGWSYFDATNFPEAMNTYMLGVNWFVDGYSVRFSTTYRWNTSVNGIGGNDEDEFRVQGQFSW
jgi:hypothetical protein